MAYFRTGNNDYNSLQYENFTADNIAKGVAIKVKDPNNHTIKTVTGTTPALIGNYTGNQTIDVSSYIRTTDTVDNFLIEITSVPSNIGEWYIDGSLASTGVSRLTLTGSTPSKTLSGNNLVISGMSHGASMYMYGNVSPNNVSTSSNYTYKLYHI